MGGWTYFMVTVAATALGGLISLVAYERYKRTNHPRLLSVFRILSTAGDAALGLVHAAIVGGSGLRFLGALQGGNGEFASSDMAGIQTLLEPEYSRADLQRIAARLNAHGYLSRKGFDDFRPGAVVEPTSKARKHLRWYAAQDGSRLIRWIRRLRRSQDEQAAFVRNLERAQTQLERQKTRTSFWPDRYERRERQLAQLVAVEKGAAA